MIRTRGHEYIIFNHKNKLLFSQTRVCDKLQQTFDTHFPAFICKLPPFYNLVTLDFSNDHLYFHFDNNWNCI